jgi:hypothetical protein
VSLGHAVHAIKQRMVAVWFALHIIFKELAARQYAVKQSCLVVVLVRNPEVVVLQIRARLRKFVDV